jgi:hypothetical protein
VTIKHLESIKKVCDENRISLALVKIPFKEQVVAEQYSGANYSLDYPQKYILDFANYHSLPYYSLLEPLRQEYKMNPRTELFVPFDPHFSIQGHQLAGMKLVSFLKTAVLTPASSSHL